MSVRAVRGQPEIQNHWTLEEKSLTVSDPKLKNVIATAMDMSVREFDDTTAEIASRKRAIRNGFNKLEGIELELRRLQEFDPRDELALLEAQISEAESREAAAQAEERKAKDILQKAEEEKGSIHAQQNAILQSLRSAPKKKRQALNGKNHALEPLKARAQESYGAAAAAAEASSAKLYAAQATLSTLRKKKQELPESSRAKVDAVRKRLASEEARVVELQQALDRFIDDLLNAKLMGGEGEEFRSHAEYFFRSI